MNIVEKIVDNALVPGLQGMCSCSHCQHTGVVLSTGLSAHVDRSLLRRRHKDTQSSRLLRHLKLLRECNHSTATNRDRNENSELKYSAADRSYLMLQVFGPDPGVEEGVRKQRTQILGCGQNSFRLPIFRRREDRVLARLLGVVDSHRVLVAGGLLGRVWRWSLGPRAHGSAGVGRAGVVRGVLEHSRTEDVVQSSK